MIPHLLAGLSRAYDPHERTREQDYARACVHKTQAVARLGSRTMFSFFRRVGGFSLDGTLPIDKYELQMMCFLRVGQELFMRVYFIVTSI